MDRDKLIEAAKRMRASKNELVLAAMVLEDLGLDQTVRSAKETIGDLVLAIDRIEKFIE